MTKLYSDLSFSMTVKIGIVSGLVGGFAIFLSIFMIDFGLNAGQGTFYKVVGLPLGISGTPAILAGMILHMLTAALVGMTFGVCSCLHRKLRIFSFGRGVISGTITGLVVFFAFFIPISSILMIPAIQSSDAVVGDPGKVLANTYLIMSGALELHVVYGIAMGGFFAIAIQHESKKQKMLHASA